MARLSRARRFPRRPLRAAFACALLLLSACGKHEPVGGVFDYAWGTPMDRVLADSAQIAQRLSGEGFKLIREPGRLTFYNVQYGLGFATVRLDFDEKGALWHGVARVAADSFASDSIHAAWRKKHGRESDPGRIDTDSGYTTFWATGSTVDRHYFAPPPNLRPAEHVRALELFHGGCIAGCPLYSVRFLPDGRALFLGLREVDPLGGYSGTWPREMWADLAARAVSVDVWTLEPEFSPTTEKGEARRGLATALENGERRTYTSVRESAPPALEQLLATLDSLATAVVWERPYFTWDTLDVRAVQWLGLDSLERLATP